MSNATKTAKRSDFKKYFQFMWRSLNIQASWNYERQMNMGFLYGIAPTLDELYPDENDPEQLAHKKEAYEREMAFYNCTPQTSAFTLGLAASMEEQYAADRENFNPETINAVKTSLMGPLSGVGDSFFQGTVRLIAFGLGISLAQQGNVLGPILAMILSIVPAVLVTWFAGKLGYTMGSKYLTKLNGGMMDKLILVLCLRCNKSAASSNKVIFLADAEAVNGFALECSNQHPTAPPSNSLATLLPAFVAAASSAASFHRNPVSTLAVRLSPL